jgi:hypothetical protein
VKIVWVSKQTSGSASVRLVFPTIGGNELTCLQGIQPQTPVINTTIAETQWYPSYTPTSYPTLETTGTFIPSPTQSGFAGSCLAFHQADEDDTCQSIVDEEGYLTVEELEEFNVSLHMLSTAKPMLKNLLMHSPRSVPTAPASRPDITIV